MTNAEAIEYIKKNCYGEWCEDDWREAMDMAIEALKCSETPKSSERTSETAQADHTADIGKKVSISCGQENDLISRQAAIDALDKRFDDVPMELTTEILQLRRDLRERIPSAQPATSCSEIPNGSDDTISRQAAIDALDEQIEQCNKALGSFDISPKDEYAIKAERASLKAYKEQLENMPTAQPEQNGKWIYNSPTTMKCDRCGFVIKDWDWHRFKYCPNCRADMRGKQDDR